MVLSTLIFLLFSVSSPGLLDQINDSYIDSVYELPDSSSTPEIAWQQKDHIHAWVDIVGFRYMAYIDGNYYIPGSPAVFAVIQSDAYGSFPKGLKCTCIVDSIKKDISVSSAGKYVTAVMHVTLNWHETLCDQDSCWNEYYIETGTFQDSELSPLIYNPAQEHVEINEVNYNHSLYAEKLIYANTSNIITRYNVSINNGSVLHRLQIGEIQYTRKNIPYAKYTIFDTWTQKGTGISYLYTAAVIQNINGSYNLQAYSPFGQVNNTNTTVTNKTWSPEKAIEHFTFLIIFILGVAFFGINKMRRL